MGIAVNPNPVVTVQVSTIVAPSAPTYQQSGAIVSFGGTTALPNTTKFLTQFSDLTAIITPGGKILTAVWTPEDPTDPLDIIPAFATITIDPLLPLPAWAVIGSDIMLAISGLTSDGANTAAFNGIQLCTITAANTFTYLLPVNPGSTVPPNIGTWQINSAAQLNSQVSTFFRQGAGVGCYLLEFGYQSAFTDEVSALENWLNTSPMSYYGYLLPDYWGTPTNIPLSLQLYQQYSDPESITYFWLTIPLASVGMIPNTVKSIIQMVEAPGVAAARLTAIMGQYSEFSIAGMFFAAMAYKATSVTRVAPMCFKYVYGVTPYPTAGNGPLLASFKQNNVNYIQTGAEGGISYTNVYQGVTADGRDYFNWWWTIDWVQIQVNIDLTNAIVNGSNNPLAPLYYNQPGINQLEAVLANTMQRGVSYGMVLGNVVQTEYNTEDLAAAIAQGIFTGVCNVNAVPFIYYSQVNPSDYGAGEYDGLSTLFIPARGFVHILVQVVATNIVSL
jgi:hypothetical protein